MDSLGFERPVSPVGITFIDLFKSSIEEFTIKQLHDETLEMLNGLDNTIVIHTSIAEWKKGSIGDTRRIYLLWCNRENSVNWRSFIQTLEERNLISEYGAIVIYGFEGKVEELVSPVMQSAALCFACPFNVTVLKAYVESEMARISRIAEAETFRRDLSSKENLREVVDTVFEYLARPIVGYDQATLSLVDQEDDNGDQYLYHCYPSFPIPNRTLIKSLVKNQLAKNIVDSSRGVYILPNLQQLRRQYYAIKFRLHSLLSTIPDSVDIGPSLNELRFINEGNHASFATPGRVQAEIGEFSGAREAQINEAAVLREELDQLLVQLLRVPEFTEIAVELQSILHSLMSIVETGWEDNTITQDFNSWVGINLALGEQTIGILSLGHNEVGHFGHRRERLTEYLSDLAYWAADAIETVTNKRHERTLEEVIDLVSHSPNATDLVKQVVNTLRASLNCDECAYYLVEQPYEHHQLLPTQEHNQVLRKWTNSGDARDTQPTFWREGEGIAGAVLAEGKSIIVPHALQDKRFKSSPSLTGSDLSLLVVPVVLKESKNPKESPPPQVLGVISCFKRDRSDHFTPYDRWLVEDVASQTFAVIERTRILESTHSISRKIIELVPARDSESGEEVQRRLFQDICESAVTITGASDGVLHLITQDVKMLDKMATAESDPAATKPASPDREQFIGSYAFPANSSHPRPRLEGKGATKHVLEQAGTAAQFSFDDEPKFSLLAPDLIKQKVQHVLGVGLIVRGSIEREQIVGAIFLNQYNQRRFSPMAMFMLELFAQQAAIAIKNQALFRERDLWARANRDLTEAIAAINRLSTPAEMYDEIVKRVGHLVQADHAYLALVKKGDPSKLVFEAGWPDRDVTVMDIWSEEIDFQHGIARYGGRKGIVGLVAASRKELLISDTAAIEENSPAAREYIDIGKKTRTELAVPILATMRDPQDTSGELLGVLNLESRRVGAFSREHLQIVLHVAQHAAIAWQKNNFIQAIDSQRNELRTQQETLESLVSYGSLNVGSENFLKRAVEEITSSVKCVATAIVVSKDNRKDGTDGIILFSAQPYLLDSVAKKLLLDESENVLRASRPDVKKVEHIQISKQPLGFASCLPLRGVKAPIGTMWLFWPREISEATIREKMAVYQPIADQVALLHDIIRERDQYRSNLEDQQSDVAEQLREHYKDTKRQVAVYSAFSLGISIFVCGFLIAGTVATIVLQRFELIWVLGSILALIAEVANLYIYRGLQRADTRRDKVHNELFLVRALDILLLSSNQLEKEVRETAKVDVIRSMADHIFNKDQSKS